jgi:signal transduction histidine kinase
VTRLEEQIFLLGKRLNNNIEGSGIGMTLIKRIIDNNEGKIEIESQVNKGSTFKICFKND